MPAFFTAVNAHPGKTDYQDGHKCIKNCREWDLYYAEYHLHDKDRNPIRVERRKKPVRQPVPLAGMEAMAAQDRAAAPDRQSVAVTQEAKTPVQRPAVTEYSRPADDVCEVSVYEVILLGAAAFLLLILLVLRIKRRRS